jgi:hypothetical protein
MEHSYRLTVYPPGKPQFVRYAKDKEPLTRYMNDIPRGIRCTFVLHTWTDKRWNHVGTRRHK